MKKLSLILFALLISIGSFAAENEFVVFSIKGKAEYKAANSKDWLPVTAKTALNQGDKIKLQNDAELVLLYKEYKTLKLDKKGSYKVSKLAEEAAKKKADESTAYLKFIWKEFNKKHKSPEEYHTSYMKTKGGVDRGGCTIPLMLSPAYGEKVFSPSITLTWEKDSATNQYTVVFYQDELEDIKLLEVDITGTSLTLSAQTFWFKPGKEYYWVVYPKGTPNCARYSFSLIKEEAFNKLLVEAQTQFEQSEKTELDAIKTGSWLEENGLLQQAGQYYYKALEMSKFSEEYKILYSGWLIRAGQLDEAKKWWIG